MVHVSYFSNNGGEGSGTLIKHHLLAIGLSPCCGGEAEWLNDPYSYRGCKPPPPTKIKPLDSLLMFITHHSDMQFLIGASLGKKNPGSASEL